MSEKNKDLVRRSWEATDNPDILDDVYTPDAVWHLPDQDIQGVEEFKQYLSMYKNAFQNLNVTVEDEIAEGDKAVTRYTLRGTQQGHLPTGRHIEQKGMSISRIEGGRIVEEWQAYDNLSVMQQLGIVPEQ
jgi:predicted ester cyclase